MGFNSLSTDLAIAFAGQLAEPLAPKFARSCVVETAIKAGAIAKRGTDPEVQIKPLEAGDTITVAMLAGVVLLSTSRPYEQTDGGSGIEAGNSASVLRLGSVFLPFAEAVTAGEVVAQDLATGLLYGYAQGTAAGSITTGRVVIPGIRVAQTISAAGNATCEVNLYGNQDTATIGSA